MIELSELKRAKLSDNDPVFESQSNISQTLVGELKKAPLLHFENATECILHEIAKRAALDA